jgi:hypothetical protein
MFFGMGLSPLLQWLILPPVLVVAYQTLGPVLFGKSGGMRARPMRSIDQ